MDFEIKKSLRVDHTDVNYCCLIMQDLIKLPFVKSHLFITPVIVDTIKNFLCRNYDHNVYATNQQIYIDNRHTSSDSASSTDFKIDLPTDVSLPVNTAFYI